MSLFLFSVVNNRTESFKHTIMPNYYIANPKCRQGGFLILIELYVILRVHLINFTLLLDFILTNSYNITENVLLPSAWKKLAAEVSTDESHDRPY